MYKFLILHLIPLKVKTEIVHRFVSRIVVLGPMFHNDLRVYLVIIPLIMFSWITVKLAMLISHYARNFKIFSFMPISDVNATQIVSKYRYSLQLNQQVLYLYLSLCTDGNNPNIIYSIVKLFQDHKTHARSINSHYSMHKE